MQTYYTSHNLMKRIQAEKLDMETHLMFMMSKPTIQAVTNNCFASPSPAFLSSHNDKLSVLSVSTTDSAPNDLESLYGSQDKKKLVKLSEKLRQFEDCFVAEYRPSSEALRSLRTMSRKAMENLEKHYEQFKFQQVDMLLLATVLLSFERMGVNKKAFLGTATKVVSCQVKLSKIRRTKCYSQLKQVCQ
jgi:hypothetical protein